MTTPYKPTAERMKIYKYQLLVKDGMQTITLPPGSVFVSLGTQDGQTIALWFAVTDQPPVAHRMFRVVGTGHPFDDENAIILGTVQMPPFVWHVIEVTVR